MKLGYHYIRTKSGFIRYKLIGDGDRFISRILTNRQNRGLLRRIYGETICRWFGHIKDLELSKGLFRYGEYKLIMCNKCKALVIFYGGIK